MIGLDGVSAQALSDTIGAIYDCALDPENWREAVRRIALLCDSPRGTLGISDLKTRYANRLYDYGYPADFWQDYLPLASSHPMLPELHLMPVGGVTTIAASCGDGEFYSSRIFKDVLERRGYNDFVGLLALRTGSRIGFLTCGRNDREPRYSQFEIDLLKLLSPHVCRTMIISDALDLRTLRSEMLEVTLSGLNAGVFLVAGDCRVVYMNMAAERQIKTGNTLRIVNHRLSPIEPQSEAMLTTTLAAAINNESETPAEGHSLALPERGGTGLIATILPLERGRRGNKLGPFEAAAAIFVQAPSEAPPVPGKAFAKLFGLTGSELRVVLALSQGLGGKEAADMFGISEATVRTHLQNIFSKTGTGKQTELVQLFRNSAPPVKG
jgi:DNA-binding CsgD family transcriptional regulator